VRCFTLKGNILNTVSEYIGLDESTLAVLSRKAPTTYRRYHIPKKKGGSRVINHPSKQTKAIQYALMNTILCDLPVHECAAGYRKNLKSPLLQNAKVHAPFSYSIRLDMKDFFPSIRPIDLIAKF